MGTSSLIPALAFFASLSLAGCYESQAPAGIACGGNDFCPGSLVCDTASQTCQLPGQVDGGPRSDGAPLFRCMATALPAMVVGNDLHVNDAEHAYWTGNSSVLRISKQNPITAEVFNDSAGATPWGVTGNTTHIYWTENDAVGKVVRRDRGQVAIAQTLAADQANPTDIVIDETHAYWINSGEDHAIRRVPLAGGAVELVLAGEAQDRKFLRLHEGVLFWIQGEGTRVIQLLVAPPNTRTQIGSGQVGATGLAVEGDRVFWGATGSIQTVAVGGGGVQTSVSGLVQPVSVNLLGSDPVWAEQNGNVELRHDGQIVEVGTSQVQPELLRKVGETLWWMDNGAGVTSRLYRATCSQ